MKLLASAASAGLLLALVVGAPALLSAPGALRAPLDDLAPREALTMSAVQRDVGHYALEPMVQIAPDGTAFYTALTGPVEFVIPAVLRSTDGGQTWEDVTPSTLGPIPRPEYTMDPYLHVDADTGRVFVTHYYPPGILLGGLVPEEILPECQIVLWSDDNGGSWAESRACIAHDHQTLFTGPPPAGVTTVGYPNVVYLCENSGGGNCRSSLDGGATWSGRVRVWPAGCGPQMGHGSVGPDGTVYVPRLACEFADSSATYYEAAELAMSRDGGATWEIVTVDDTVGVQRFDMTSDVEQAHHDAYVAVDDAGVVHYLFLDGDSMPRLVESLDGGATWSAPRLVAPPDVQAARLGVLAAGAGHLALGLVGSTEPWSASDADVEWHAWLGVDDGATTTWTRATPADDPLKRGPCQGRCPGSHPAGFGMYDFVNIAIDPTTGMAWMSMMDMCPDGCTDTTLDPTYDHPRGAVAIQTS